MSQSRLRARNRGTVGGRMDGLGFVRLCCTLMHGCTFKGVRFWRSDELRYCKSFQPSLGNQTRQHNGSAPSLTDSVTVILSLFSHKTMHQWQAAHTQCTAYTACTRVFPSTRFDIIMARTQPWSKLPPGLKPRLAHSFSALNPVLVY